MSSEDIFTGGHDRLPPPRRGCFFICDGDYGRGEITLIFKIPSIAWKGGDWGRTFDLFFELHEHSRGIHAAGCGSAQGGGLCERGRPELKKLMCIDSDCRQNLMRLIKLTDSVKLRDSRLESDFLVRHRVFLCCKCTPLSVFLYAFTRGDEPSLSYT